MQIWPWCRNEPQAPAEAAFATSTSSRMTRAELPPSSRCVRLRWRAASSPMRRPTAVEPVNEMIRTSGSVISASPVSGTAGQHVQQALGQPGLLEDPGEHDAAADRGARVRLEHHRVAERERRGDRAGGQDLREVERRDHADDADRDPLGEAQPGLLARQQLAVGPAGEGGRLVDLLGGVVGLEGGGPADLAALPDHPVLDLGGVGQPEVGRPAQDRGPLGVRGGGPGRLRGRRLLDRAGHVVRGREADAAELAAGGGLDDGGVAAVGGDPAAGVDLALPCLFIEKCHDSLSTLFLLWDDPTPLPVRLSGTP